MDTALVRLLNQPVEILQGAIAPVDASVITDVVAKIDVGRRVDRAKADASTPSIAR